MIKCLVGASDVTKDIVNLKDKCDGIRYLQLTMFTKQFTDGDVFWAPQCVSGFLIQLSIEKYLCALIRENNCNSVYVLSMFCQNILCYKMKEGSTGLVGIVLYKHINKGFFRDDEKKHKVAFKLKTTLYTANYFFV